MTMAAATTFIRKNASRKTVAELRTSPDSRMVHMTDTIVGSLCELWTCTDQILQAMSSEADI